MTQERNSPVEQLPPELRRQVLLKLDFDSLRAMVYASRTYYGQYLHDQTSIYTRAVTKTLGYLLVEAHAVCRTATEDFQQSKRSREHVIRMAKSCIDSRLLSPLAITMDEATRMIKFHLSTIRPIAQRYTEFALSNLARATETQQAKALSGAEEVRLLRAIYRFQLCCNLFSTQLGRTWRSTYRAHILDLSLFVTQYEPWEIESIACFAFFMEREYWKIFETIRWDVDRDNPENAGELTFDFSENGLGGYWVGRATCRGLDLFRRVVSEINDHEELVTTMSKALTGAGPGFFCTATLNKPPLDTHTQGRITKMWGGSPRFHKQIRRDPLPFMGDGLPDAEGYQPPPLAWTLLWKDTYSILHGDYISGTYRSWGYLLWDAERLQSSGGDGVVVEEWASKMHEDFGGEDPRDVFDEEPFAEFTDEGFEPFGNWL